MHRTLLGEEIDNKYLIQSVLGEGGLGVVYKAEQKDLSRFVAIKMLKDTSLHSENINARFQREAKVLSAFQHPHIVSMYSFGIHEQSSYIVMEYLEGPTLAHILALHPRPDWKRIINIIIQVCQALEYAHTRGIVHRDLKPQNIILLDKPELDFVKVLDFGMSKFTLGSASQMQKLTQTGALVGTVHYLAPEACLGQEVEAGSDIYSLGCILYECLTGYTPWSAGNDISILHKHISETPTPLPSALPRALRLITLKAMEKKPENRFQSMQDFADALNLVLEGRENELNISLSAAPNSHDRTGTRVIVSSIALITLIAGSIYFTSKRTAESNSSSSTHSQILTGRQYQISKANKLVAEAQKYLKEENRSQAAICVRKALLLISIKYKGDSLRKEFAREDLAILRNLLPVLSSVQSKSYFNVKEVAAQFKSNNQVFLSTEETIEAYTCFSDMNETSGNYGDSINDLYFALKNSIDLGKVTQSIELLHKLKAIKVETREESLIREIYADIADARIQIMDGNIASAKQSAGTIFSKISESDILSPYDKSKYYLEFCTIYEILNDSRALTKTLCVAKEAANQLMQTHPDQLYEVERRLANAYIAQKDYARAEAELKSFEIRLNEIPKTEWTETKKAAVENQLKTIQQLASQRL